MVFRTSPQLGPGLEDTDSKFFYDFQPDVDVSPLLGNTETGSDGHQYTLVKAASTLAANATFGITESTWVTTTGTTHSVPALIKGGSATNGNYFWARKAVL